MNTFDEFLDQRLDINGLRITSQLDTPEQPETGCWCLAWNNFDEAVLPTETSGPRGEKADWILTRCGAKIEALYSTIFHGCLHASEVAPLGTAFSTESKKSTCSATT